MDAPLYPPAAAFEQPRLLPQPLSTRTSAIGDLLQDAEAKAVIAKELPALTAMQRNEAIAVAFEPLSLRNAAMFGGMKQDDIARIEAAFARINARRGVRP